MPFSFWGVFYYSITNCITDLLLYVMRIEDYRNRTIVDIVYFHMCSEHSGLHFEAQSPQVLSRFFIDGLRTVRRCSGVERGSVSLCGDGTEG